jgi:transcription elongation factor Elf1/HD superfamily phosphohydrolase YqeK
MTSPKTTATVDEVNLCPCCQSDHVGTALGIAVDNEDSNGRVVCPNCGLQYRTTCNLNKFETLVEDLEKYPRHNLSESEVKRRLPAVENITDPEIKAEVLDLSAKAPAYFWVVPAANNDYHHPRCREQRGLWVHTLMVAQAVKDLLWTYRDRDGINGYEEDLAFAAAILHDQRKNGPHESPTQSATDDHDLKMAAVVRQSSSLPGDVANAIARHMGPSYDGPVPSFGGLSDLVHMADYAASRRGWEVKLPEPVPTEINSPQTPIREG